MKRFLIVILLLTVLVEAAWAAEPVEQSGRLFYTEQSARLFDLEARVACQTAVEEVFWQYQTWPAENPDPKPAFEQVAAPAAIQAQVEESLRQSNALLALWRQPITGEMLQAEMNRMARQTRQPAVLRALFAALGNDPAVIAECLARPALVNRLLSGWYGRDERFTTANQPFRAWWEANQANYALEVSAPAFTYTLPVIEATAVGEDDTWADTPSIPNSTTATAVWTGSEVLFWGGGNNASYGKENFGWSYNPATDTWATLSNVNAPEPRASHTAVWTGTEMIVWGGCDRFDISFCATSTGGRYNPVTDAWQATNYAGAPPGSIGHSVIWTGSKMIVWGGCTNAEHCYDTNTGGVYDPATNSWTATSLAGAPSARTDHTAVWSGSEMIVWGGWDGIFALGNGGRYNPTTNTWQPVSSTGAPSARVSHKAVWAEGDGLAGEMIIWGGCDSSVCIYGYGSFFNDGARYNPATNTWTAVSLTNAPSARVGHSALWTGNELLIWGGSNASSYSLGDGGRYSRLTNSWSPINTANASPRSSHRAVWTGELMIVWGGSSRDGERYSPAADTWTPMNESDPNSYRSDHTAVWTGTEMINWGGSDTPWGTFYGSGVIYTPATATWRDTSLTGAPSGRYFHTTVWTGTEMIVWGGQDGPYPFNSGGRYNPLTNTWTATRTQGAPAARGSHTAVWTGRYMMVWGGSGTTYYMNTGGAYDARRNRWITLPTTGAPAGRYIHTAVWTGSEMIVWGGVGSTGYLNNGGRFNPITRTWTLMTNTNAPSARYYTASVWTGSEMVVWGGRSGTVDNPTHKNDGGRYNPTTNTWQLIPATPGLEARSEHTAVWTGQEMIVWGGWTGQTVSQGFSYTGGRYNPTTSAWRLTNLAGAPSGRTKQTAVWTGTDMIIWGGSESGYLSTGGHYYANNAAEP